MAKRKADTKCRVQFHLEETLIKRLGVHCSLVQKNQSAVVEKILTDWLTKSGRGRELWGASAEGKSAEGVDQVDRSDEEDRRDAA